MNPSGSARIPATHRISRSVQAIGILWLVLALGSAELNGRADESPSKPAGAPSAPGTAATPTSGAGVETTSSATQAAISRRLSREKEAIAQERLRPTTPEKLIERHGFIGSLFAKPTRVNPLQLINPKAPKEYGGVGEPAGAWSWNPLIGPGQAPLPRGFEDPVRHEATAVLVGGSFR